MTEKITNNKKANHTENQGRKRNNHCNKSTRYAEQLIFSICVYYTALGDLLCTPGQDSSKKGFNILVYGGVNSTIIL